MFRLIAATLLVMGLSALPASAADAADAVVNVDTKIIFTVPDVQPHRPAVLPTLYASFVSLQAYDVYSTRRGLSQGAIEANPLMQGVVGSTPGFIAMKAVTTGASIFIAERLWKTNRKAAIITMIVANGVMGAVAANNARVLQQTR